LDGISKIVEKHERHTQLGQHLALASGNVYDARCPACKSMEEKFSITTIIKANGSLQNTASGQT